MKAKAPREHHSTIRAHVSETRSMTELVTAAVNHYKIRHTYTNLIKENLTFSTL